jgi:hypothetical protein
MLDVKDSIMRLARTVEQHHAHIAARHEFSRQWAIQFQLAYTDFRVIQVALQLDGTRHDLLVRFASAYDDVYVYEYAFAAGGLEGFDEKFAGRLESYKSDVDLLLAIIAEIGAING